VDELREVGRPEQHHRVDVAVTDAQAEVQDAAVVVGADAAGGADDLAASDGLSRVNRDGGEERVRRAQAAGVRHGHVQRARDRAGEAHGAVVRRDDRCARDGGEVDAPMAGAVDRRRFLEGVGERAVDRPLPPSGRLGGRCGGGGRRERERDGDEQEEGGGGARDGAPWTLG
jgi:hypothetical protein